jgi:protocatechuate 3,4-dioxygenase alpha subunit
MKLPPTASQTIGPFLHIGTDWLRIERMAPPEYPGRHLVLEGRVLDGDGAPVPDALVEVWQADSTGHYSHPDDPREPTTTPGFQGFGRVPTDDGGRFRFSTIMPGPVPHPSGGLQSPHLLVSVFMRGLLDRVVTRCYFPDEALLAEDRVLQSVPPERRGTLVAHQVADGRFEWDVVLQGPDETVFFDC